jgi:hypothetical protein
MRLFSPSANAGQHQRLNIGALLFEVFAEGGNIQRKFTSRESVYHQICTTLRYLDKMTECDH